MSPYQKLLIDLSKKISNKISFEVINPSTMIPYGFRPHTRSISWLAEQVITQHIKSNIKDYGIENFEESKTDISVYDFIIKQPEFEWEIVAELDIMNIITGQLQNFNVDTDVVNISKREIDLYPFPPPGSDNVVQTR